MRPRTQKQPQVKKEPCRVLDDVDVSNLSNYLRYRTFWNVLIQVGYT